MNEKERSLNRALQRANDAKADEQIKPDSNDSLEALLKKYDQISFLQTEAETKIKRRR